MDENGSISIYSRNQENNTSKYPDIISRVKSALKDDVRSFILDTEAVAWDLETQKIRPFQILTTRKRKVMSFRHIHYTHYMMGGMNLSDKN